VAIRLSISSKLVSYMVHVSYVKVIPIGMMLLINIRDFVIIQNAKKLTSRLSKKE